ncbi:predicted protein [Coccidioides posadasii str. Silveira]|uniref:Predicted protein n=1 Tax=Coccidioides posadasii (strain RMSCC 757 / Silveira) TaxID=443226 RepID=E9D729_COCPS|nr:predicted protein [Coccidioides posadasii str. Silveira]
MKALGSEEDGEGMENGELDDVWDLLFLFSTSTSRPLSALAPEGRFESKSSPRGNIQWIDEQSPSADGMAPGEVDARLQRKSHKPAPNAACFCFSQIIRHLQQLPDRDAPGSSRVRSRTVNNEQ